jgi:hypothetical protein
MTIVIPFSRGFSSLSGICVSLKFILVLLDPLKNIPGYAVNVAACVRSLTGAKIVNNPIPVIPEDH